MVGDVVDWISKREVKTFYEREQKNKKRKLGYKLKISRESDIQFYILLLVNLIHCFFYFSHAYFKK